jgi:hypothetical protein
MLASLDFVNGEHEIMWDDPASNHQQLTIGGQLLMVSDQIMIDRWLF